MLLLLLIFVILAVDIEVAEGFGSSLCIYYKKNLKQEKNANRICRSYANQFHLNLEGALGYLLKQKLIDDGEMRVKMAAGATLKAGIWKNR